MLKKTKTIQVSKCILVCPFINHTHMYTTLPVLRFLLFHSPVHKFIVCNIFQHSMMTDIPPHSHHLHKQHIHKILMTISYTLIHQQVVVLHVEQHFSHWAWPLLWMDCCPKALSYVSFFVLTMQFVKVKKLLQTPVSKTIIVNRVLPQSIKLCFFISSRLLVKVE